MSDIAEVADRLLTEIERQEKYLAKLPEDFQFPLFNAAQALESQRRSGYRNTAAAAREIVDNAIEAGATSVHICFERPKQLKSHQRAESISAIAFIDNGSGMIPKMAQYALTWGSSTHFEDPNFIGKFGFGLPNASINQTKFVEVYTKTADAPTITKAWLDARIVKEHGLQVISEPIEAELPAFVQTYLDKQGVAFEHGTIVVWVEPDRITYRTPAVMKEHLVDDFGVTYRYLLSKVDLFVERTKVEPVDPLFLTDGARYYLDESKGGAQNVEEWTVPVKYVRDSDTGGMTLSKVEDVEELKADNVEAGGVVYVRVSRFPYGFVEDAGRGKKAETVAHRRFEIRKTRRGMSFVRAGREIETVDVFPKSLKDEATGLGHWPLLQSYAYHWGVEVRFDPQLDEVFGITNEKQTVRPIQEFWRILAGEGVDKRLGKEQAWQRTKRQEIRAKQEQKKAKKSETQTKAETAAANADSITGVKVKVADRAKAKAREDHDKEVKRRSKVDQVTIDQARDALEQEARRRPYVIDFYDDARGPFYKPEWQNGSQIAVMINRLHPFFQAMYSPLLNLENGAAAKQALDILLISLARAELAIDEEQAALWYEVQRERAWSPYLSDAYKVLQQMAGPLEEETFEPENIGSAEEDAVSSVAPELETAT